MLKYLHKLSIKDFYYVETSIGTVFDIDNPDDPMLKQIFKGLNDMQTLGHPWRKGPCS